MVRPCQDDPKTTQVIKVADIPKVVGYAYGRYGGYKYQSIIDQALQLKSSQALKISSITGSVVVTFRKYQKHFPVVVTVRKTGDNLFDLYIMKSENEN